MFSRIVINNNTRKFISNSNVIINTRKIGSSGLENAEVVNMAPWVKDKVVMITGASSGIGACTAEFLAANGATVAVTARRKDKLDDLVIAIEKKGGKAIALQLDVADSEAIGVCVEAIKSKFGRIDGAFNNAGIMYPAADQGDADSFDKNFEINVRAVNMCMQAQLKVMIPQKSGSIINNSSIYGFSAVPSAMCYGATKAAVNSLTKSTAIAVAATGVTVNAVNPGYTVPSEMLDEGIGNAAKAAEVELEVIENQTILRETKTQHYVDAKEIANAVAYFMHPLSRSTIGQTLAVCGGAGVHTNSPFSLLDEAILNKMIANANPKP